MATSQSLDHAVPLDFEKFTANDEYRTSPIMTPIASPSLLVRASDYQENNGGDDDGRGDDDDGDDSSADSHDLSGAHFPPVLPSFNPSASKPADRQRNIAAAISMFERSSSVTARGRRLQSPQSNHRESKSRSRTSTPQHQFSRFKRPPPPPPPPLPYDESKGRKDAFDEHQSSHTRTDASTFEDRSRNNFEPETDVDSDVDDDDDDDDGLSDASSAPVEKGLKRLSEHYGRLRSRREGVTETLRNIQIRRSQVQALREQRNKTDRAFMAAAQSLLSDHPALHETFQAMQTTRLQYDAEEQYLDDMIDALQHEVTGLELAERRFFSVAAGGRPSDDSSTTDESDDDDDASRPSLKGISGDRHEDVHPLYEELKEAMRDMYSSREYLTHLRLKRNAIEAKRNEAMGDDADEDSATLQDDNDEDPERKKLFEDRITRILKQDEIEFLLEFPQFEERAIAEVDDHTNQARRLEKRCRDKGLMPKNATFGLGPSPIERDEIQLPTLPRKTAGSQDKPSLAHPIFPILLSNPVHVLADFPQTPEGYLRDALQRARSDPSQAGLVRQAAFECNIHTLISETKAEDKTDFINRWLLHKLHLSAMEAELYFDTFRTRLRIPDLNQWQRDMLRFWWRDKRATESIDQYNDFYQGHSSVAIEAPASECAVRPLSDSGQLDFLGSWDVDEAWP